MTYKLTEAPKLEKVNLSEDGSTLLLDYTLIGEMIDGDIILKISDGCTIELPCPAELVEAVQEKVMAYFNNKYVSK